MLPAEEVVVLDARPLRQADFAHGSHDGHLTAPETQWQQQVGDRQVQLSEETAHANTLLAQVFRAVETAPSLLYFLWAHSVIRRVQ